MRGRRSHFRADRRRIFGSGRSVARYIRRRHRTRDNHGIAGIVCDAAGLSEAAARVDHWGRYILPLEFDDPTGWTMQNMLIVARLMIVAAADRRESRGVHFRRDFPQPDPALNVHIRLHATASAPAPTPART